MGDFARSDTGANQKLTELADRLEARGVRCGATAAGNVKVPRTGLEPQERELIQAHKSEFVALLRGRASRSRAAKPSRRPRPKPEPEPVVYVWPGRRVTEADVLECLRGAGDETLADYRSGELPKADAYDMTKHWLRERELRRLAAR